VNVSPPSSRWPPYQIFLTRTLDHQDLRAAGSHYVLNDAYRLTVQGFDVATFQFPVEELAFRERDRLGLGYAKLDISQLFSRVDRIETSEPKNDPILLKPEIFNFQIFPRSIREKCYDGFEPLEPLGEIGQNVRQHLSSKPPGFYDLRDRYEFFHLERAGPSPRSDRGDIACRVSSRQNREHCAGP
jgi:hypothetical protein